MNTYMYMHVCVYMYMCVDVLGAWSLWATCDGLLKGSSKNNSWHHKASSQIGLSRWLPVSELVRAGGFQSAGAQTTI